MFKLSDRTGTEIAVELDGRRFTFTTQILPGADWERLLIDHRPKHDGFDYDPETFPPAAILASVTGWTIHDLDEHDAVDRYDRPMNPTEARELWDEWPQWARRRLLTAIELQNVTGRTLGKPSGRRNVPHVTDAPATV